VERDGGTQWGKSLLGKGKRKQKMKKKSKKGENVE
jgi:hypothetical protein